MEQVLEVHLTKEPPGTRTPDVVLEAKLEKVPPTVAATANTSVDRIHLDLPGIA
jgi:hypothetical protein